MKIRKKEEITQIPYATWYGYDSSHNPNTMLSKVLDYIGEDKLLSYYKETIEKEQLTIKTIEDLENNLIQALSSKITNQKVINEFQTSSDRKYDFLLIEQSTNKKFAIEIKPVIQYGVKYPNSLRELLRDCQKEFKDFELIVITFKTYKETVDKYFKGINVQYIGDLLNIDEDKLIILPKFRGKGAEIYETVLK